MQVNLKNLHISSYLSFRKYLDEVYYVHAKTPVIPLSLGYPISKVFPLPNQVLEKLNPFEKDGTEKIRPGYGWEAGSQPLRETIIKFENSRHSTHYSLENVCMTAGGSYGINRVLEHLFCQMKSDKNEVLIVAPTFYRMLNRFEEYATVQNYLTQRKNMFQPTVSELKRLDLSRTRAIFICNPTNPGYNYIKKKEIQDLIEFLDKKKIYLIIDEVGDNFFHSVYFRYPKHIQSKYVIRICSSSKAYQLAEYRLGYIIADSHFIGTKTNGFVKLIGDDMGNPPLAANDAWQYILESEREWLAEGRSDSRNEYQKVTKTNEINARNKCNLVTESLQKSPYVTDIIIPDASFNVTFQWRSKKISTDIDFFKQLLQSKHVSLVPCSGFGFSAKQNYMRLTFAVPDHVLQKGLLNILEFLDEIN